MEDRPVTQARGLNRRVPIWIVVAAVVALIGASAGGVYLAGQPKNGVHVEQLEADIHEQLPIGSSREAVLEWFTAHGITDLSDLLDTGGGKAGYKASVPNDSWTDKATIEIMCRIDRKGQLKDVTIFRSVEH
jgi:hypothetical protein